MKVPVTPAERAARLRAMREAKIAANAHAFVRASAGLFYELVAKLEGIPSAPSIWISGDCHGENLGFVADAHGACAFEMNDLDEAVIGNPAHDVLRLALSFATAAEVSGLSGLHAHACVRALVDGYADLLEAHVKSAKTPLPSSPKRLADAEKQAQKQTRVDLMQRYCGAEHPDALPRDERVWPLSNAGRAALEAFAAGPEARAMLSLGGDLDGASVQVLDVGFRVAGTASLGGWRALALVKTAGAKGERRRLIDVKEAQTSSAIRAAGHHIPADDAERITCGARALAPCHGARLAVATVQGRRVVARELMPQERKVTVDGLQPEELTELGRYFGAAVARAHCRQLDPAACGAWRSAFVGKAKSGPISWVWDALSELTGPHRRVYLRHCGELAAREKSS